MKNITSSLLFLNEAEEAAQYYVSIFPHSEITNISYFGDAGPRPKGTVLAVSFLLNGQPFIAINGASENAFTDAVSFQVECESQAEIDHYWEKLTTGGEEGPCGWLKDRFGVSWQVASTALGQMMSDPDVAKVTRVMGVMMKMKKLNLAELEKAYAG